MKVATVAALSGLLLAACSGESLTAEQQTERAETAVALFAEACVVHQGQAAKVAAWAQAKAQPLPENEQRALPLGMMELDAQAVWTLQRGGAVYYLSLAPDSCSIKTERADDETVRARFAALAAKPPQGMAQELRADRAVSSPFPFRQLSYAWRAAGSGEETVLSANTSPSTQLPAQAALYLVRRTLNAQTVYTPDL